MKLGIETETETKTEAVAKVGGAVAVGLLQQISLCVRTCVCGIRRKC